MNIVRSHVLISMDAGTIMAGARGVQAELSQEIKKQGLSGEVAVLETGSLGVTGMGVVLVVYPEGLYYANVTKEDVREFVEEQLLKGRLVKRLLLTQAPKRFIIRRERTGSRRNNPGSCSRIAASSTRKTSRSTLPRAGTKRHRKR